MRKFYVQKPFFAAFFSYILALVKNSYKKCARLMLMKLTPGVNFTKLFSPSEKLPAHCAWQKICLPISPTIDSPKKLTMPFDFMLKFL
jgi:hypothetical protein